MMTTNRIMMAAALALGGGLFLAGAEANACGNGKVIFEDKFATLDPMPTIRDLGEPTPVQLHLVRLAAVLAGIIIALAWCGMI